MKKIESSILVLCVVCALLSFSSRISWSRAQQADVDTIDLIVTPATIPAARDLANTYKKGLIREKLGAYENALFAYTDCNIKAVSLLSGKNIPESAIQQVLPYLIASAYRKGILTHRSIEGSVMKLYKQLEMYEDANTTIDEALTVISNLSTERGVKVPPQQYYVLYYARAYNRMGWAYALLNGSAWKRYIVYTPADTITMVDKSISDMNMALSAFDIDPSKGSISQWFAINNIYGALSDKMAERGPLHITFALSFDIYDIKAQEKVIEKQLLGKMGAAIEFYNKGDTTNILNKGRKIFTYEEFMKSQTKELITTLGRILDILK